MALLNNPVAIIITISLVIQIIVLLLLVFGYWLKKKMKYRNHGIVMSFATVLHLVLVLYVMIPSFVLAVIPDYVVPTPLALTSFVGLIHGILGTTALSLGVWFVASWGFRKNIKGCINKKKIMTKTFIVWIASLILVIILYSIFIGPLLVR
jgi:uncharacterized membrane protein YozB (DUF420 family)